MNQIVKPISRVVNIAKRNAMYDRPYFIYEVVGVKVGCTCDLENRLKAYGNRIVKILEVHWDIEIASDRERDLQVKLGYRLDTVKYYKSYQSYSTAWQWVGKPKPKPEPKYGLKYQRSLEKVRAWKKKTSGTLNAKNQ